MMDQMKLDVEMNYSINTSELDYTGINAKKRIELLKEKMTNLQKLLKETEERKKKEEEAKKDCKWKLKGIKKMKN